MLISKLFLYTRVADPDGLYHDPNPDLRENYRIWILSRKKLIWSRLPRRKSYPDPTLEIQPGFGSDSRNTARILILHNYER